MANYDYKCNKCKKVTTITKSMSESSREEYCEECGEKLQRIFAPVHNKWNCSGSYARGSF